MAFMSGPSVLMLDQDTVKLDPNNVMLSANGLTVDKANCQQIPMKTERLNDAAKMPTSGYLEYKMFSFALTTLLFTHPSPQNSCTTPLQTNSTSSLNFVPSHS